MHNNIPLTKEHQMMPGEGEVKRTQSNPREYSCQCKIRLPTQVYMFSIRRSRLLNTLVCKVQRTCVQILDRRSEIQPFVFYITHTCTTCCFRNSTVSSRWLQLVATPVKYDHNSIENISTLSNRVTVVLIASKLDVGLSHNLDLLYQYLISNQTL